MIHLDYIEWCVVIKDICKEKDWREDNDYDNRWDGEVNIVWKENNRVQ